MKSYIYIIILFLFSYIGCRINNEKKVFEQEVPAANEIKKPNVIVILIDDAGYVDFGFMGSEDIPTPEIDKLAKSGVIFSDAHVSSTVCAPSRAGLMTGQYQQRHGFEANGAPGFGLSDDVITMADVFKAGGYKTYALGKWHLGDEDPSNHPNKRGFDDFYGFLSGGRSYFPIKKPSKDNMLQHNGERVIFDGYMTDVLGEQSAKYAAESAKKKEPFFMYLAYNAVHTPMEAKAEDLKLFEGHPRQTLAAMTWSLDENVGKLRKALKDVGELDNTLIFFLSDNGGAHNNDSKTGPLKGWKGNEFEGGHRVPFVVSWPGQLKPNQTFDGLTSSLDIFKTTTEVAGLETPKSHVLDGVNIMPYLKGEKTGDPHQQLFWRKLEESAARIGDYKLVGLDRFGTVLYNVEEDLGEVNDLTATQKQKSDELLASYKLWEKDMQKPLWDEGEKWMKVTYHIQQSLMQNKEPLYKAPGGIKE